MTDFIDFALDFVLNALWQVMAIAAIAALGNWAPLNHHQSLSRSPHDAIDLAPAAERLRLLRHFILPINCYVKNSAWLNQAGQAKSAAPAGK